MSWPAHDEQIRVYAEILPADKTGHAPIIHSQMKAEPSLVVGRINQP